MRKCGNMCLYRRALTGVFAVLLAVEISACGGKAKPGQETGVSQKAEITQEKASAPVWKDMRPERSMELSYAKQFSVDYYDGGYDLIQVQDDSTCLVVPEGAAVPEGLPTTVTIVLALGVTKMARAGTIVRRLPSVETLGAVSVVCSDKTGTLTKNEMTVTTCYVNRQEYTEQELARSKEREVGKRLLEVFALCSDAGETVGDATERALYGFCENCGVSPEHLRRRYPRKGEIPFDSDRKRMTTVHEQGENWISCVKGAPDVVLKRCRYEMEEDKIVPLTRERRTEIEAEITRMSARALRVLAGAYRELQTGKMPDGKREKQVGQLEQNLIFLGLAGMMDPPREAAAGAVEAFRRASVRTVMITGDHADTALAIARQLGIAKRREECMTGAQLETLDEGALEERIGSVSVFARVSPEHKVRIVRALKRAGCVTAMTGDGVNDAPALKSADIGIAMGKGGTDVARQAASRARRSARTPPP